jgi:hypothetical protein
MKNSHCLDPKMEAYCDEVRRLEDKFYGLELNHIAQRYNETADELAKIASGRTMVPPDVFSRDLHQPSVKTDDTPEPEKASAQPEAPLALPEAPLALPEAPLALPEAPLALPEAPSAPEGEALRVEEERNGVPPNRDWQTPYLQYLHRGELPLNRAEARRLARRAKSFVLLGDEKELYHCSPSGILQRCISVGVSRPGVPGPTSEMSPRAPAQMGRRETEHEGGKKGQPEREREVEIRGLRVCPVPRSGALAVGGYKRPRGRGSERPHASAYPVLFLARPTLYKRALVLPFIGLRRGSRCTLGV